MHCLPLQSAQASYGPHYAGVAAGSWQLQLALASIAHGFFWTYTCSTLTRGPYHLDFEMKRNATHSSQ